MSRQKKNHHILIATHIEQAETVGEWQENLKETVNRASKDQCADFEKTISWWHQFWDRSHIFVHPEHPDTSLSRLADEPQLPVVQVPAWGECFW